MEDLPQNVGKREETKSLEIWRVGRNDRLSRYQEARDARRIKVLEDLLKTCDEM